MTDDVISDKQIFDVIRNYQSVKLERNEVLNADYDVDFDLIRFTVEELVLALKQRTVRMSVYDDYETPTNTWQMFKSMHCDSWWMRWFTKRWLVKYDIHYLNIPVEVDRYQTFPDAGIDLLNPKVLGKPITLDVLRRL